MYHISNLGNRPPAITTDIHGYVPMPGDAFDDFAFDTGSEDLNDKATRAYWEDVWFADVCAANKAATDEAEQAITAWTETD